MSGRDLTFKMRKRADELRALPPGWDTYGGKTPDGATLDKAVELALAVAPLVPDYDPALVPCSDGSVQVEWHDGGYDVEMWVQRVAES